MNSRTHHLIPIALGVAVWLCGVWAMPVFGQTKIQQRDAVVEGRHFQIASYYVAPRFMSGVEDRAVASDGSVDAKSVLERVGISFGRGCSARFFPKGSYLVVCNTAEQIEVVAIYLGVDEYVPTVLLVSVIVEQIEIERDELSAWLATNRLESDATELRRTVQNLSPIPEKVKLEGAKAKIPKVAPGPTAWECRDVGRRLEVQPVIRDNSTDVDLSIGLNITGHDKALHSVWPNEEVPDHERREIPTYDTRQVGTTVIVTHGGYGPDRRMETDRQGGEQGPRATGLRPR